MYPGLSRREWIAAVAGLAAASGHTPAASSQSKKTRLILLGTGGGPRPRTASSASAQVVVVNDQAYVIDCGNGVARQLVAAGLPLTTVRHVFITHHHSDHNADYGNLLLLAWASGLKTRVDAWGPPPLEKITRLFFEMSSSDIEIRMANEGRPPLAPLVHVHELNDGGPVMQDEHVKVTAAVVDHPPMVPSFAFRFDGADRSIVISGDTARSDRVVALAKGADVLVHSAVYLPAVDRLIARVPNATALRQAIVAGQTSVEDAGRVATAAGVKTLVLSHLIPPDDPTLTEQMWLEAARPHFEGAIVVGKDLLEI
jgi:ribonuclease BN (tRNA processing enzyme)